MRKPFFVKQSKCWFVKDAKGKYIRLDPDENEAYRIWNQMLERQRVGTTDEVSFTALAESWLTEHESTKPSFIQSARYLSKFCRFIGDTMSLKVTQSQVGKWLAEPKPGRLRKDKSRGPSKAWSQTTRRDAARAVYRVFEWAAGHGKLSRNPLFGMKIPEGKPRAVLITKDQHRAMILNCRRLRKSRPLALYLIASQCGARPRQIREVTAAHVLPDISAWVFSDHKEDDTGKPLVVYLDACLGTLTRILMHYRPSGYLFRNTYGKQWKSSTIVRTVQRLRKRANVPDNVTAYAYRHTFATDSLLSGNSLATVAELLGHVDTRMVGKVYGHLDQHRQHLIDAVNKTNKKKHN